MPAGDQLLHVAEEKGEQQRDDMSAVHVGIRHDDHFAIAQIREVELAADPTSERLDQRLDLIALERVVHALFLYIQDLASQRKDRLEAAIAALLGRAPG